MCLVDDATCQIGGSMPPVSRERASHALARTC